MSKILQFLVNTWVFKAKNAPKPVSGGGAYDVPRDLLVGWGGRNSLPISVPIDAFGVSISSPLLLTCLTFALA